MNGTRVAERSQFLSILTLVCAYIQNEVGSRHRKKATHVLGLTAEPRDQLEPDGSHKRTDRSLEPCGWPQSQQCSLGCSNVMAADSAKRELGRVMLSDIHHHTEGPALSQGRTHHSRVRDLIRIQGVPRLLATVGWAPAPPIR